MATSTVAGSVLRIVDRDGDAACATARSDRPTAPFPETVAGEPSTAPGEVVLPVIYEWDSRKAERNVRKHGVSFPEAATVFLDPHAITFDDPDHSEGEQRFITVGSSSVDRILFVAHADRGDLVRIISARKATRREVHEYEEGPF